MLPGHSASQRPLSLLGLLVAALGLSLSLMVVPYQMDDAFITYRYAANALAGHGLAFNPGGSWTEGFSSPLWLALVTAGGLVAGTARLPVVATCLGVADSRNKRRFRRSCK